MATVAAIARHDLSNPHDFPGHDPWSQEFLTSVGGQPRAFALTNFAGRCYPTQHAEKLIDLLEIRSTDRVLDLCGGETPLVRADAVADVLPPGVSGRRGPLAARAGARICLPYCDGRIDCDDGAFEFVFCRSVLEQIADPATLCAEMMRVARRGFLETTAPLAEYLGGRPQNRWLVSVERTPDGETIPVFRGKPFRRAPFRHALRPLLYRDPDFRFRWEQSFRNVTFTQFAWNDRFRFRVETAPGDFRYDSSDDAAEAHLDAAINALRFGGCPSGVSLFDADQAVRLRPEWAVAHNARACALWKDRRYEEAWAAFQQAVRLQPERAEFRENARPAAQELARYQPRLVLLPPEPPDCEDIERNFAGKVYYAFVGYDARLARDLSVQPEERVLDVGGGQRPLERADVSADFDVFEGLHRQGQPISREKPLVCGDVQRLPFREKAFDVACCRMVLEHVRDPAAAVRELQRVARRGFIETPNRLWECFYGHPTHRWLVEFEPATRTLVFRRKPFAAIPFRSAIVPLLYTEADVQRAFEITFRNLTTVQVTWDAENPLHVRVEDDPDCPYDYLDRPEDAAQGNLNYAQDLLNNGLCVYAGAEIEDALRCAATPAQKLEALRLRYRQALAMNNIPAAAGIRREIETIEQVAALSAPYAATMRLDAGTGVPAQTPAGKSDPVRPTGPPALIWNAPLRDPSGYADEARHFLFALDAAGVDLCARELRWSDRVAVLPADRERTLHRLLSTPPAPNAVSVCHILAPHFRRDPQARACIGRTMFETDRLPETWVHACNMMDAVWVPGRFNQETFARSGVRPEKLRIVPGAIDLAPYDPTCAPLTLPGARGFNFLTVFDWTLRKGWDVLLRAYVEEFRAEEDVALLVKTHSSLGYTIEQIGELVGSYLIQSLGRDPDRIPDIVLQGDNIPDARMPNLYRAADCFVLPTRGEGWGRPCMEAMAMRLPVIATGWSGLTAFLDAENSLPLDYELVDVPAPAWQETPTYRGHRWAEPSCEHLRTLLRLLFENRAHGAEIGQRARACLESRFTYPAVAEILRNELERFS